MMRRKCVYDTTNFIKKSVKKELKSDHACTIIEEIAMSKEINMKYVCHYSFIDVTAF